MVAADEFYVPIHDGSSEDTRKAGRRRSCGSTLLRICCAIMGVLAVFSVLSCIDDSNVAKFSVGIAAVEGLNGTAVAGARTVSPGFSLTARVENPRALTEWCSAGGQAVVSYAGVSLAWGPVPAFCAPRKGAAELAVAASGTGVGLSDDLRRRFAAEWNMGVAQVVVEMKLFYDGKWLLLVLDWYARVARGVSGLAAAYPARPRGGGVSGFLMLFFLLLLNRSISLVV